jgi:phosphate starvation-inducible protein PhoH and related proteins
MGSKRSTRKSINNSNSGFDNVVKFNNFRKKTSVEIIPRNKNQETYLLKLLDERKDIVFGIGPAGTGKTLIAVLVAIKEFKERKIDKIIVTRPAVSVDEDLGALPGTLEEKMAPWTRPVFDIFKEYFDSREISSMLAEGIIEIAPLSYMRGRTFKDAYIIADEMQNSTPNQMKMLLTRLGENSKMVVTGDLNQADRLTSNGLLDFLNQLNKKSTTRIDLVQFGIKDVERHQAVKEVLSVYGEI